MKIIMLDYIYFDDHCDTASDARGQAGVPGLASGTLPVMECHMERLSRAGRGGGGEDGGLVRGAEQAAVGADSHRTAR